MVIKKLSILVSALILCILSVHANAAPDEWSEFNVINWYQFEPENGLSMRIYYHSAINPAACITEVPAAPDTYTPSTFNFDISTNRPDMSAQQVEQMLNTIYIAITTQMQVKFLIDGTNCSSSGRRILKSILLMSN